MKYQEIRTLKLLQEIERNNTPSQRDLAKKLNISLGLVNSFIKRLAQKGYFKISTIPRNRVMYILTPKGMAEKTQLTYEYIQYSYHFYKKARRKVSALFKNLDFQGVRRIVFFGISDITEIAFISLQETSIELVAIVDNEAKKEKYLGMDVENTEKLKSMEFDKILITSDGSIKEVKEIIINKGISENTVITLE